MKTKLLAAAASLIFIFLSGYAAAQTSGKPHTPKKGSVERARILDALRGKQEAVKFKVYYLKAQDGWAWIDATPLGANGKAVAEGGASLLRLENGAWTIVDLSSVPADPDNPMGADDVSAKYIANLRATFPEMPLGIVPKSAY